MSNWSGFVLTKKGQQLLAKVEAGETLLNITKMKTGDGVLPVGQALEDLTDLVSPKQLVGITTKEALTGETGEYTGETRVSGTLANNELEAGYSFKEWGIFADDPDSEKDILYAISIDSAPDYIPPKGSVGISQKLSARIVISNAASITIVVDMNAMATMKDLTTSINNHNTAADAHADIRQAIEDIDVSEDINKHNTASDAHADIRQAIENIDVSQDIQKHNMDPDAHALAHVLDVDDTVVPTSNHGALAAIMNNVANMLKKIKGDTDWKDNPAISLAAILGDFATNLSVTTAPDTGVFTCASLGITGLMAQNGYICLGKLFGGLILQWGTATVPSNSGVTVTFPIAFTQACFGAQADAVDSSTWGSMSGNSTYAVCVNGVTTTNLRIGMVLAIDTAPTTGSARWFAYGV